MCGALGVAVHDSNAPARCLSGARARAGRVLVVDDDAQVARSIKLVLGAAHDVSIASNGAEALALIEGGERFDVILCDLTMPVMSGPELHAHLSTTAPAEAARLVFITGCAVAPHARVFLDRVPNTWLEKPFDIDALRAFVERRVRDVG